MLKLNKEDLTIKEYNSLYPTYGLLDGVNFLQIDYYKCDNGEIWEVSYCTDGSLNKRMNELEKFQRKMQLMRSFGF